MADEKLDFEIGLTDNMSGPSKVAAESMMSLARSLTDAKEKLGFYSQQLSLAKKNQDAGAFTKYNGLLGEQTQKYAALHEAVGGFAGAKRLLAAGEKMAGEAAANAASHQAELAKQMTATLFPAMELAGPMAMIAEGLAAAAVAATGAVVAVSVLTYKLANFAIAMTQGHAATVGMFDALGEGVSTGVDIDGTLDNLSRKIGITKDAMQPLARSFMAMGITGVDALSRVVLAAESARAIMSDPAAADAFEHLTRKIQTAAETGEGLKIPIKGLGSLALVGLNVNDVAKKMGMSQHALAEQLKAGTVNATKFGDAMQAALIDKGAGPLKRLAMNAESLKSMLGQFWGELFEGMDKQIAPVLGAVKSLFGVFDSKSTPSGYAMKTAIGGAFQFIFKTATPTIYLLKHFFLQLVLWSIKAYIYLKKHWSEIRTVFEGVRIAVGNIVAPFAVLAVVMTTSAAASTALGVECMWLLGKLSELARGAKDIGKSIVDGLINGMTDGLPGVLKSGLELGKAALFGTSKAAEVKSPSRAMFRIGGFATEGLRLGLHAGVGGVTKSAARVGSAVMVGAGRGIASRDYAGAVDRMSQPRRMTAGSGGMKTGNITINMTAPNGVTNALELTEVAIATLFERLSLQQGT